MKSEMSISAGFQRGDLRGGVADEAADRARHGGGALVAHEGGRPVVGVVAIQHHFLAAIPGDEAERPGADRMFARNHSLPSFLTAVGDTMDISIWLKFGTAAPNGRV